MRLALCFLIIVGFCTLSWIQVVPRPQQFTRIEGAALRHAEVVVQCVGGAYSEQALWLVESLRKLGGSATVVQEASSQRAAVSFRNVDLPSSLSYRVSTEGDSLRVLAANSEGAAAAVSTLLQLLTVTDGECSWRKTFPCVVRTRFSTFFRPRRA